MSKKTIITIVGVLLLMCFLVMSCDLNIAGPTSGSYYGIIGNASAYSIRIEFVNYFTVDLPSGSDCYEYLQEGTYTYKVGWLTKDGLVPKKSGNFTVNGRTNDAHYGSTYCDFAFVYDNYYRQ